MKSKSPTLYKVLVSNKSCHGGVFDWTPYLPAGKRPGTWTPPVKDAKICDRGWHLTTAPMAWATIGMEVYRAEGKDAAGERDDKRCFRSVRLLAPDSSAVPQWWRDVEAFIGSVRNFPWFRPLRRPAPDWIVCETRAAAWDAARDAAGDAAWAAAGVAAGVAAGAASRAYAWAASGAAAWAVARAAAGDAAGAAAWDASLLARILVCDGLPLAEKHRAHARARWAVWQAGYGLCCDVSGVLYVYRKP